MSDNLPFDLVPNHCFGAMMLKVLPLGKKKKKDEVVTSSGVV